VHLAKSHVVLIVLGLTYGSSVCAKFGDRVSLDIPQQPLELALNEFARQSGLQILFEPDSVTQHRLSPRLHGDFQIGAGLAELLAESGLKFKLVNEKTVAIRREASVAATEVSSRNQEIQRLVEGDEPGPGDPDHPKTTSGGSHAALPEILVTGTKSINVDIRRSEDDIQPYTVISREVIENSGAKDVGELLRKNLPVNTSLSNNSVNGGMFGNTTDIDLRGLGSNQTLILIDGRQAASFNASGVLAQPDLNSIPLAAIERVEVLPVSASGIYGGRATGGVVNVVLKHDYSGFGTSFSYSNPFKSSASTSRLDFSGGTSFANGASNLQVSGSFTDSNPLLGRDRDFYRRAEQMVLDNNPSFVYSSTSPPLGATTNISSVSQLVVVPAGTPGATCSASTCFARSFPTLRLKPQYGGVSIGSYFTAVPEGYGGAASDGAAALRQSAGKYNLTLPDTAQPQGGLNRALLTDTISKSIRATFRQELSPSVTAFLDVNGSKMSGEYLSNDISSSYTVSRSAPNNPFDQNIRITTPALGADRARRSSVENYGGVLGAIWRLPWKTWQLELDYTRQRVKLRHSEATGDITDDAFDGINSGDIDVLQNKTPVNFGDLATSDYELISTSTDLRDVAVRAGGEIFTLPAGGVSLSVVLERQKTALGDYRDFVPPSVENVYPARSQRADSAYSEIRVPIFGSKNAVRGIELLEAQVAGRYDRYKSDTTNAIVLIDGVQNGTLKRATNEFSSGVPTTFGVRYAPLSDVMFRASYGEGFLAPQLTQLVPGTDQIFRQGLGATILDPKRGNTPITTSVTVLTGGNSDLRPEDSISRSFGVVLKPRILQGSRFSFDRTRINKTNNIGALTTSDAILNEQYIPGAVTRAAPQGDGFAVGPITAVNTRYLNLNKQAVEANDFAVGYSITGNLGTVDLSAAATEQLHYRQQITPSSPETERVGVQYLPRWLASSSVTWSRKNWFLNWSAQYLGAYWYLDNHTVDPNYADAKAPSAVYHDFSASYRLSHPAGSTWGLSQLSSVEVVLGINNVFDRQPRVQFSALSSNGFDPRVDPRLRSYFATLRVAY
jgi:iron complex outermembrane recepter protein